MNAQNAPTLPAHLLAILQGAVTFGERAAPALSRAAVQRPAAPMRAPGALVDMPEIEAHDMGAIECNDDAFFSIGQGD